MKKLILETEIFTRGVADIVTRNELSARLRTGKPMRIKHGIDATAGELHIGHAVSLWKLRALQEAGHKAVILFGDVTTAIGDPTGRSKTRPVLSAGAIRSNVRLIEKQVRSILLTDSKVYEVRRSSEWYAKMSVPEFLRLLSMVTHARLIERDMFQARIKTGAEIFAHELVYPILQGYDSVRLRADMTVIGHDQLFNEHMGRFFQEKLGQDPQIIMALSILPGIDGGEKMSKSLGNYIGLGDSPRDKFGKAMRIPDPFIVSYLNSYTDAPVSKIREIECDLSSGKNPRDAKLFFAESLTRRYHGEKAAKKEKERFLSFFSRHEIPTDIPTVKLPAGTSFSSHHLLVRLGLARSMAEARRLISEGAVEIDGVVIRTPGEPVKIGGAKNGTLVRVGKRKILKVL